MQFTSKFAGKKYGKMGKTLEKCQGKVREFCQSEKVGALMICITWQWTLKHHIIPNVDEHLHTAVVFLLVRIFDTFGF